MSDERPVIEVTIAAPVEAVWASLRDPALVRRWHGWHADELDEEIQLIFFGDEAVDDQARVLNANAGDRFDVEAVEDGTRVRVTRAPYVPDEEWSAYYGEITEGWISFLHQLKFMHERHPDEDRRTIFLMGRGAPDALDRLRYSVPTTVGETWYEAEHQDGVLLPDLGPGLLIRAAKDPAQGETGQPAVDTMAIVTTYGLDDDRFAAERDRWTGWWRSAYPEAEPAQV